MRLVKGSAERDRAGSWSPDGNWFVYIHWEGGRSSLNKVKTTGQAEPEILKAGVKPVGDWLPVWSPSGDWILYADGGVKLISPDGKTTRHLSSTTAIAYAFSADGQTIYGIRPVAAERLELFSVSVAGGTEKTIGSFGREHHPRTLGGPATRLSLAPDGTSLTFSTRRSTSNLWLIEGLNAVTPPLANACFPFTRNPRAAQQRGGHVAGYNRGARRASETRGIVTGSRQRRPFAG